MSDDNSWKWIYAMREQGHFDMTLRICLQIDHYYKQESVKMQEN